jgi:sigma-B regulation protein RsbU (phosphoserine phosphatase)
MPGFVVAKYLRPLEATGGDMIWHRRYPTGVVNLVLADAMGHGDAAGVLATKMSLLLDRITRDESASPAQVVSVLNDAMLAMKKDKNVPTFATGVLLRFAAHAQCIVACHFGHHGPIFSKSGLVEIEYGPLAGVSDDIGPWPETVLRFTEHGHRLCVFTDGITEQFNPDGEMFNMNRLERAFLERLDQPVETMLQGVIETLESFRSSALIKDDQAIVAVEYAPSTGRGSTSTM